MPRRRPSFVPLLFVAVLLALCTAARQSAVAEPPPDVPDATLALGDSRQPARSDSAEYESGVDLAAGSELIGSRLFEPREIISPRATPSTLKSVMLSPDMAPGEIFSSDMMSPSSDMMMSPTMMRPACQEPVGPLRAIWNLPTRMADWVFHPPRRHRNIGCPLTRESWRYRPFGLGLFVGYIRGGTLIDDWTGSSDGTLGGFRLSWDPGYYWGCEFRYAATSLGQWDSLLARETAEAGDGTYNSHRDVNLDLWDFSLLYYPWGDAAWRPYALVGLGGSQVRFDDCMSEHWSQQVFAMPLALGLKYRYNSRLAFRFEVADNIVFGAGRVDTIHHFSVTGGVELRFGGHRKAYWPWSPGRYYW